MSSGVTLEEVLNMIKENDFDSVAGSVNDEPNPGEYDDQLLELDEDEEEAEPTIEQTSEAATPEEEEGPA